MGVARTYDLGSLFFKCQPNASRFFSWTVLLQSYLYFIAITQQNEHEKTTMTTQNEHYNKIIRSITQTKLALYSNTVTD